MGSVTSDPKLPALSSPALKAWSLLDELVIEVHGLASRFPPGERDGLGRALRDSALASVSEFMRGTTDGAPALRPAVGAALASLAPLRYQLYLARRLNLLDLRRYRIVSMHHDRVVAALKQLGTESP